MGSMSYCTLTGADCTTSVDDLLRLSDRYPFAEWGILYSETQQGTGRYPSLAWIDALIERIGIQPFNYRHFALHICGRAVNDYLIGIGDVTRRSAWFDRVQINFNAARYDVDLVASAIRRNSRTIVITQDNDANAGLRYALGGLNNHAMLFDSSGGRGIERTEWPQPWPGVQCGYAGGLGPETLVAQLPAIDKAAAGARYWIDMERRLRDNRDRFDLGKAERCLEIAQQYAADIAADNSLFA